MLVNKRLQLNEIYTSSASNNNLNKHKFTYNSTNLPPRNSWGKDFLGYHNNSYISSISAENANPRIYFYPDQGLHSFLPMSRGAGYYLTLGNYSLAPNLNYAKAGVLEKIEYPTGGFSEFEYELNQFIIGSGTLSGGDFGLNHRRLKMNMVMNKFWIMNTKKQMDQVLEKWFLCPILLILESSPLTQELLVLHQH